MRVLERRACLLELRLELRHQHVLLARRLLEHLALERRVEAAAARDGLAQPWPKVAGDGGQEVHQHLVEGEQLEHREAKRQQRGRRVADAREREAHGSASDQPGGRGAARHLRRIGGVLGQHAPHVHEHEGGREQQRTEVGERHDVEGELAPVVRARR